MDLSYETNHFSSVTGQMTRDGVTGNVAGTVDQEDAGFSFTVIWPDASETTGEASVYDEGHMKRGSMTDAGTNDTSSAKRQ